MPINNFIPTLMLDIKKELTNAINNKDVSICYFGKHGEFSNSHGLAENELPLYVKIIMNQLRNEGYICFISSGDGSESQTYLYVFWGKDKK